MHCHFHRLFVFLVHQRRNVSAPVNWNVYSDPHNGPTSAWTNEDCLVPHFLLSLLLWLTLLKSSIAHNSPSVCLWVQEECKCWKVLFPRERFGMWESSSRSYGGWVWLSVLWSVLSWSEWYWSCWKLSVRGSFKIPQGHVLVFVWEFSMSVTGRVCFCKRLLRDLQWIGCLNMIVSFLIVSVCFPLNSMLNWGKW